MSFKPYPKYKESGVEWLGRVPEHWVVCPVKSISTVVNGYPFDSKLFDPSAGHPLIRIRDLNKSSTEAFYTGAFVDSAAVTAEDVLIGMDGDFNVGRWKGEGKALLNQRMCCLRGQSTLHARLLEYALPIQLTAINAITYSTTVKHLSSSEVEHTRVAIPVDEAEMEQIAAFLDHETAKIDALIAEQQRLIQLLQEKRQAVISHAVTKGLNPDAPMKDSGIEWLGEVPEHWAVIALKRIAGIQTGVAKGKDNGGRTTVSVPYLRVANVQDGYLDLDEVVSMEIPADDLPRYSLRAGDVLMNEGGDFDKLGRGCVWDGRLDPCITQNHVFAVRPRQVSSAWLSTVTGSSYAQFYFMTRSKQSTNLASISSANLMELPVVMPPDEEQRAITQFTAEQIAACDGLMSHARLAITLLQERRSALISAAVTGQIDVRDFAPGGGSEAA